MNHSILFTFYVVVTIAIGVLAWVAARWFHRLTNGNFPLAIRLAGVLYAVSADVGLNLLANIFGFKGPRPIYTIGYGISYWSGRTIMAGSLIALVMFQTRKLKEYSGVSDTDLHQQLLAQQEATRVLQVQYDELHSYTHAWIHELRNHMTALMLHTDLPVPVKPAAKDTSA